MTSARKVLFRASGGLACQTAIEMLDTLRALRVETFGTR